MCSRMSVWVLLSGWEASSSAAASVLEILVAYSLLLNRGSGDDGTGPATLTITFLSKILVA